VEKSQLEKELASEKQKRQATEDKNAKANQVLERVKSTSLLDIDHIEILKARLDTLNTTLKEREHQENDLEALTQGLRSSLEVLQVEAENMKSVCFSLSFFSFFLSFFFLLFLDALQFAENNWTEI